MTHSRPFRRGRAAPGMVRQLMGQWVLRALCDIQGEGDKPSTDP
jgi:hypothetical protein